MQDKIHSNMVSASIQGKQFAYKVIMFLFPSNYRMVIELTLYFAINTCTRMILHNFLLFVCHSRSLSFSSDIHFSSILGRLLAVSICFYFYMSCVKIFKPLSCYISQKIQLFLSNCKHVSYFPSFFLKKNQFFMPHIQLIVSLSSRELLTLNMLGMSPSGLTQCRCKFRGVTCS